MNEIDTGIEWGVELIKTSAITPFGSKTSAEWFIERFKDYEHYKLVYREVGPWRAKAFPVSPGPYHAEGEFL